MVAAVGAADAVASSASNEADAAIGVGEALLRELRRRGEAPAARLGDLIALNLDKVDVEPSGVYPVAGVLIAGGGLFRRQPIAGSDTSYKRLTRLHEGQLVYRKLTAWEGPVTVVPEAFEGSFVSPEFPTYALDKTRLVPGFMRFICETRAFHRQMRQRSQGTAERRGRLDPEEFLELEVPLPKPDAQVRIAAAISAAVAARQQAEAAREIAGELPARLMSRARTLA